jgi:hypothetical protein
MSEKLNQLFSKISDLEPTHGLEKAVSAYIELERRKRLRLKLAFSKFGIGLSMSGFLYAVFILGGALVNSDFASMLTLAFSDLTTVAQNWNTYAFSLLETLPAIEIIGILFPALVLFWSFSFYSKIIQKNFHRYLQMRMSA